MVDTRKIRRDTADAVVPSKDIIFALCDEIDRLRADIDRLHMENATLESFVKAGAVSVPKPQGKTVKMTVKVAVDYNGNVAVGEGIYPWTFSHHPYVLHTLTADLPIPEETTVDAEVDIGR